MKYSIWIWEPDYDEGGGNFEFFDLMDSFVEVKRFLKSNTRQFGKIEMGNKQFYFYPNELKDRGSLLDKEWFGGNLI